MIIDFSMKYSVIWLILLMFNPAEMNIPDKKYHFDVQDISLIYMLKCLHNYCMIYLHISELKILYLLCKIPKRRKWNYEPCLPSCRCFTCRKHTKRFVYVTSKLAWNSALVSISIFQQLKNATIFFLFYLFIMNFL